VASGSIGMQKEKKLDKYGDGNCHNICKAGFSWLTLLSLSVSPPHPPLFPPPPPINPLLAAGGRCHGSLGSVRWHCFLSWAHLLSSSPAPSPVHHVLTFHLTQWKNTLLAQHARHYPRALIPVDRNVPNIQKPINALPKTAASNFRFTHTHTHTVNWTDRSSEITPTHVQSTLHRKPLYTPQNLS